MSLYKGKSYKYRSFGKLDDNCKKRVSDLLVKNKLFFANPTSLNDPFELRPCLSVDAYRLRRQIEKKIDTLGLQQGKKARSKLATEYMIKNRKAYDSQRFQAIADSHVGVFCMSKKPDLLTQWAYYGDEHKGFCIEFDFSKRDQNLYCVEVEYVDQLPVVDMPKYMKGNQYTREILKTLVKTKSRQWRLEQEVRLIIDQPGVHIIPPGIITGVIFGAKIDAERREFIENLNSQHNLGLNLRQCNFSENEYGLTIN